MYQRGCGNEGIAVVPPGGDTEAGAAQCHISIHRQNPPGESGQHALFDLGAQNGTQRRITRGDL